MKPELFHFNFLGSVIHIPSYLALAIAGFVLAWMLMGILAKEEGVPIVRFYLVVMILSVMLVIGARLLYVLHSPERFTSLSDVFYPSTKGFAVMGGLILVSVVSWPLLPAFGLERRKFWDIAAGPVALGLALGRVGCFLAGCCFGKTTNSCLGVLFPWGSQPHRWQIREGVGSLFQNPQPVYPTQIFEMVALLIIGILEIWIRSRRCYAEGTAAVGALMLYLGFRLLNLNFRADPSGSLPPWVYPAGYLVAMAACAAWIYFANVNKTGEMK